jgi:hypothetical protein
MRSGPVDPEALGARFEMSLSFKHKGRDSGPDLFPCDSVQQFVTGEATGQDSQWFSDAGGPEHLLQLLLDIFAFQKNKIIHCLTQQQPGISGEQDAPLLPGQINQFVIRVPVRIEDIETGDPQPFGQATEHHVGYKRRLRAVVSARL